MRPQYCDQMKLKVASMESYIRRAFESTVTAIASAMRVQGVCTTRPETQKFPNSSNSMQPRLKLSHLRSLNIFLKYSKVRNTISSPQEAYRRRCLVRSHSAGEGPRLEGSFWNLELCLNLDSLILMSNVQDSYIMLFNFNLLSAWVTTTKADDDDAKWAWSKLGMNRKQRT